MNTPELLDDLCKLLNETPVDTETAVEAIRRIRRIPGNCAEANAMIDLALAVQLAAERVRSTDGGKQ